MVVKVAVTFIVPIANGKLFVSRLNMIVEPLGVTR